MAEDIKLPSKIVIDASVILCRLLPDEKQTEKTASYFLLYEKEKLDFTAPVLIKYEVANALKSAVKQKRLSAKLSEMLLCEFLLFSIEYQEVNFQEVLKLALEKNISVYDASYVWLASLKKLPLLSLDKKLSTL